MSTPTLTRIEGAPHFKPTDSPANGETQSFSSIRLNPLMLELEPTRTSCDNLNQLLADTLTLRDLYKKHHWQAAGPHFYPIHLLFDKHAEEQTKLADMLAERVQTLGGVSIAMAADVAEITLIPRAPKGRENTTAQINRLMHAHEVILVEARAMARISASSGDLGTNDLIVSDLIRLDELQSWFLIEHLR